MLSEGFTVLLLLHGASPATRPESFSLGRTLTDWLMCPCLDTPDLPAPMVSSQATWVLCFVPSIASVWSNYFDPITPESCIKFVGVVGVIADQILWSFWDNHLRQGRLGQLHFVRPSTFDTHGHWKAMPVCHGHDLCPLTALRLANLTAPFFAGAKLPSMKASRTSRQP
jgi:hypothetical protein